MKKEMEDDKKRVIEDLSKAKAALDNEVPGIGSRLMIITFEKGIKLITGAMNLFSQYKMMDISGGLSAMASLFKGNAEEATKLSNSEDTTTKVGQNQPELKAAFNMQMDFIYVSRRCKEGEQLELRRLQIDENCMEAKAEIKALAEKSRKDMERKIEEACTNVWRNNSINSATYTGKSTRDKRTWKKAA
ncbi:unnamed protein product [Mytilus edulis]|uniref:Uncharacterized protein n=1 Tax=Mytilus edulis TaxID=6550 RepID=A0A8S3S994_MYTED|nr:unnamed protein product [Mytilus edulis]